MEDFELDFDTDIATTDSSNAAVISERAIEKIRKGVKSVKTQAGEGEVEVKVSKQRRITKANDFCMIFYKNIGKVLNDGTLQITRNDMRVLFKLLEYTQLGNLLSFSQTQIATELGMTRQSVNRSMRNLRDKDVVLETARGMFFNPLVVCKGGYTQIEKDVMFEARKKSEHQYSFNWDLKES